MNTKHCESCPLHSCQSKVATKGKGKYLVVTDPPTASASLHGRVFTPAMAGVFQKVFSKAGFEAADFSYHPAVCCPYDEREFTNAENKIIRAQCRQHLREAVRAIRPEVIIPLGAMAARQVAGHPVKITKVRGVPVFNDEFQCMVLPMYHPGFVAKYPQHQSVFLADALTLNDLEYFNYDVNRLEQSRYGEYELIEDLQFLIDLQPKRLAFDLETLGTRWYIPGAKILTMQFCTEPGRAYMLLWDHPESRISLRTKRKLKGQLRQLLQNPRTEVVNHNLLYDRTWVQWHLDIAFPISHDTLMLAALLDENSNSKDQSTLVKQYVPEMAGYDDCVLPHTRLLTADLRWVRAGEVQPGDELMGFDEEVPLEGCRRKLRVATAVSTKRLVKPCVRIRMSSGRVIECSEDHGFLSSGAEVGSLRWRRAYQLSLGDRLKLAAPDVEPLTSFDAGWMSGFLDGEGYCSRVKTGNHEVTGSHTFCLGWSQNPGKVHDKAKRIVQDIDMGVLGYGLSEVPDNRKECITTKLMGWNALKVMMLFRPERLIEKQVWAGAAIPREDFTDTIASIQSIGEQEVVSLETSTHTFVAEGICSHNSFNSKYSKDRMDLVPVSDLLGYAAGDSDSALRLLDEMLFEIQQDDLLWAHYQHVSIPGLNVFANIHCRGMRVDTESLDDFGRVMAEDLDERYLQLIAHVPRSIKRQHIDKGLSFSRPDFVRDILFNHPDGLRLKPVQFTKTTEKLSPEQRIASISTKDHLPFFYDADPFVVELASYLKDSRLLNANILRFREKYVYEGAIYPSYNLHTARTGRSASKDPNGQNMPKRGKAAKAYRKAFRAPPGHFILVGDLSQAELRIAGDMAKEPTMIRIYSQDGDIHRETALIVSGKSEEEFALLPKEEQDLLRFKAKAVNFGFIYGMWWRKFRVYAKTQYGVDFSEEEAQRIRRDFFRKYSGLERWHATMRAAAEAQGYVRSYTGRVRHLPMIDSQEEAVKQEALRQAINSPVQETASSWGVMAMAALDREVDARCMTVVGFIHDAIVLYVRKEFLEWGALTLKHYMESVPVEKYFGWRPRIPLKADVSFGEDLSKMYEFKNLNSQSRYDFTPFREEVDIPLQIKPLNCGRYV